MATLRTKEELRDKVLAWIDETGDTDTTKLIVDNALEAANITRLLSRNWEFMKWNKIETLSITTDQKFYALHPEFFRSDYFWNRTDKVFVEELGSGNLYDNTADWNDDVGPVEQFEFVGRWPVAQQPAAASVLTVASTSGTDGAQQSITVRGDTEDGIQTETIVCGTTGSVAFTHILQIIKDGTWTGTMSLTDADATVLLTLGASQTGKSYPVIRLLKTPDRAATIEYRFFRGPNPFDTDNALSDIPLGFAEILVWDTLIQMAGYNPVESNALSVWKDNQQQLEKGLMDFDQKGHSLGAQSDYVTYIPR